jgi:hypothetical protein
MPGRIDTLPGVPSPFAPSPSVAPIPKPSRPPQRRIRKKRASEKPPVVAEDTVVIDPNEGVIDASDSVEIEIEEIEE